MVRKLASETCSIILQCCSKDVLQEVDRNLQGAMWHRDEAKRADVADALDIIPRMLLQNC